MNTATPQRGTVNSNRPSVLCSMVFVTAGIALSYRCDLPSGPVIALLAGAAYLAVALAARLRGRGTGA